MDRSKLADQIKMHQVKLGQAMDAGDKVYMRTLQSRLAAYNFIQSRGVRIDKQIRIKV